MKYLKFTTEDVNIIVKTIKQNPHNLSLAFKKSAKLLKRSEKAVSAKYYNSIKNNSKLFLLGNNQTLVLNTKNVSIKKTEDLKYIMKIVVDMKPEFQNIVRDYLNNI